MEWKVQKQLSFTGIRVTCVRVGADYHILLEGGSRPHIGCTVLTVPRPSLRGDGTWSATASVLNVVGHKDEVICRWFAEQMAAACRAVVVCTGGFHTDDITEEQLQEIADAVEELIGTMIRRVKESVGMEDQTEG